MALNGSIIFNFIYKIIDIMTKCFTIECNYKEADISLSMTNLCVLQYHLYRSLKNVLDIFTMYKKYNSVSEWLLFNANSVIIQLYHGENIFQWDDDEVHFVLDQQA